jgi:gluconokinase
MLADSWNNEEFPQVREITPEVRRTLHCMYVSGRNPRRWLLTTLKSRDGLENGGNVVILLMGVSGAGKTTVGGLLSSQLGWEFVDGDDFHSASNVEKMRSGVPLTDTDRGPWLETLLALIAARIAAGKNIVLACSALKSVYRERLQIAPEVHLVYLRVDQTALHERLRARRGHFMTERMLESQLEALEEPKQGLVVDGDQLPVQVVAEIRANLWPAATQQ